MTKEINAEKLYNSGIESLRRNRFKQAVQFFLESAKLKYTPAIKELGICFFYGIGVERSLSRAIKYYKISKSHAESQYELYKLYYFGHRVEKNKDLARKLLIKSALLGFTSSLISLGMFYILKGEQHKANLLFSKAYSSKDRFATHLHSTNLFENSQDSVDFINQFDWPEQKSEPTSYKKNILNSSPDIFFIEDLLSQQECEYIKFVASPFMRPSMTVDPDSGDFIQDEIRTSHSAGIDWISEDPVIHSIMEKCCHAFSENTKQSEPLHVLHYTVGEEYKPHYDFFGGVSNHKNFDEKQQRIKTICLYLNEVSQGGETSFPRLNLEVKAQKGGAVFFENANRGTLEPYIDSLHSGKPVIAGEKWLATLWIHNQSTNRGPDYVSIPS